MKKNQGIEGIDPAQVSEVLRRMDVLEISKSFGFVPIGEPDKNGWQGGVFPPPVGCGMLNIGQGLDRGNWRACESAGPGCWACCASLN